jgi:cobalt-zinc-cadmium efflux system protein
MLIEIIGGFFTQSIALISDAGHMFTHCFAIGISLLAIIIARKPPCHHRTFGLFRAEILAAFVNGLFLLLVAGVIIYEAILRIIYPKEVLGFQMFLIALIGLSVNLASIFILYSNYKDDLNIKSVFYHMVADTASSIGIIIAAAIIFYTGWNIIDPLVSLGISALIIFWALGVLRKSTIILLEMAPIGLNIDTITDDLKNSFPEIKHLFNIHLWTITQDMCIFSAYIKLHNKTTSTTNPNQLIAKINKYLSQKYKITEATIQLVHEDGNCNSSPN